MALLTAIDQRIILASASPRRRQLFRLITENFEIMESDIDESFAPEETPPEIVRRLAYSKAARIAEKISRGIVVGADSLVVLNQHILGKPANAAEAAGMLRLLSGAAHQVFTGFSIIQQPENKTVTNFAATTVKFRNLAEWEIQRYLQVGEPLDKAGAYGIQNEAALFIEEIFGCYYNVMGLPVSAVFQALLQFIQPNGQPF
jgi:septum formation protein